MGVLFLFGLVFTTIFILSFLIGAVMFVLDVWKWSKRPERYTSVTDNCNLIQRIIKRFKIPTGRNNNLKSNKNKECGFDGSN